MSQYMRAVVVAAHGGPDVLELVRVPAPPLGPDEVRVRVRSIGLNFRDVKLRTGPSADVVVPFTPGSDFAGDIVEVGAEVASIRTGDRVFGVTTHGAYAEEVVTPAVMVMPIPDGAEYDTATILPVAGLSASFLLSTAGVEKGQTAVTYAAAGGLGCFLGGLLAAAGVQSIGITSSGDKAAVARAAGHDEIINYRDTDPVRAVKDLTDSSGADVVFDSVAGPGFGRSFRMLSNHGTVVLCGRSAGDPDLSAVGPDFLGVRRNLALREFYLSTHIFDHLGEVPDRLDELATGLRDRRLNVPITTFALDDVRRAHELLGAGATVGKLILHP